jgi:hypothetical protein
MSEVTNSVREEEGGVMTIAMKFPMAADAGPADDVSWRALRTGLWVGRRDGRHLGTVERGRRWSASDAEGEPIGAFRTLREAQAAVADPEARRVPVPGASGVAPAIVVAGLVVAALLSASGWVWTALLV